MRLRVALLLGVVLAVPFGTAMAQMSPPMGNLAAPQPRSAQPATPSVAPQPSAVPRAPVQQVAPMASPPLPQRPQAAPPAQGGQPAQRSQLGQSQPGKPSQPARPPVVAPKPNAGPQKPAAAARPAEAPARPAAGAGVAAGVAAGAAAGVAAGAAAGAAAARPGEARPAESRPAETRPAEARPAEPTKGSETGQPLPRWAGIMYDGVKLRVGPGQRYPVEWVYRRPDQPVRILREFQNWRLVEDHEGVRGWVHQSNLTGRRSFMVPNERTLRRSGSDEAGAVAVLRPGVVGRVRSCEAGSAWCQVRVGEHRGWIRRDGLWGLSPGEPIGN
jgi:SH3-like domain-containing protein